MVASSRLPVFSKMPRRQRGLRPRASREASLFILFWDKGGGSTWSRGIPGAKRKATPLVSADSWPRTPTNLHPQDAKNDEEGTTDDHNVANGLQRGHQRFHHQLQPLCPTDYPGEGGRGVRGVPGSDTPSPLALLATPSHLGSLIPILGSSGGKRLTLWAHSADTPTHPQTSTSTARMSKYYLMGLGC